MAVAVPMALLLSPSEQPPKYKPAKTDYGKVNSAWEYQGAWPVEVPAGQKLVAADIELPDPPDGRFDLDDIDIFDADSGESFGSGPSIQRLTPAGELVDDRDPAVEDRRDYRGVFVWAVGRGVRRVNFGYWGDMLFKDPVTLQPTGRTIPNPGLEVVAVGPLGRNEAYDRHLALLHARDWSRIRTPARYTLHSSRAAPGLDICGCDAWLEVDAATRPVDVAFDSRPYYEKDRWFLAEFWCPAGSSPDALSLYGDQTPLPPPAPLAVGPETLGRLAAAERNPDAWHRLKHSK